VGAATKQQYSFYNFLRWFVMASFIYFCYKAFKQNELRLLIFSAIVSILFNPFEKIWFQRQTWHLIDYSIAGIIALTIIYDCFLLFKIEKQTSKI
jgi:Ca2+/H+ antiporter